MKEARLRRAAPLEEARQESQRLRLEAEDYADQKLAQFEIVLERTLKTVASGRQKLSGLPDREDDSLGGGASGGIDTMPGRARTIPAPSDLSRRLARPGAQVGGHNGAGDQRAPAPRAAALLVARSRCRRRTCSTRTVSANRARDGATLPGGEGSG